MGRVIAHSRSWDIQYYPEHRNTETQRNDFFLCNSLHHCPCPTDGCGGKQRAASPSHPKKRGHKCHMSCRNGSRIHEGVAGRNTEGAVPQTVALQWTRQAVQTDGVLLLQQEHSDPEHSEHTRG